ncbi:MAG: S8 family serine peptidase [Planctomycetota bacterium]|jgi:subtilisin family serine protease
MRFLAMLLVLALPVLGQGKKPAAGPRNVIVLGKTQLLNDAKAFDAFCAEHAKAKRSELRTATIAKLKEIAAAEQPAILKALGDPKDARSLWLVNAVVVRLDDAGIEKAKKLDVVKWVYPAGRIAPGGNVGKVAEVIKRQPSADFTTKKKTIPWNLKMLNVPKAWKEGALGEDAVVAMFDAGMDYRHADLRNNVWINEKEVANNGKDDDGNGLVDDVYGYDFLRMKAAVIPKGIHHGTFTSSIVAGDGTGGQITGVAPRARLMALIASGGPYNACRAFQYALEQGADVVNMSFSIPGLGHTRGLWRLMAEHATCSGLVLVSGAGNFPGQPIPVQIRIPEGIPCVICVGGVTKKKKFARFTSQGPVEWSKVKFYEDYPMPEGLVKPDVAAFPGPGTGLIKPGATGYQPENNRFRGNSLSAPHVAGVCALVLSVNPELTPWRVKALLEKTARDLPPRGKDPKTGAGLVDAVAAVKAAKSTLD